LTGGTGAVQTQYTYDPYGTTTASGSASSNPIQYAGMQNDRTGQYFDHARYYSPGLDRFTAQDPIGCTSSEANLYRYVADDPTNFLDPLGLTCTPAQGYLAAGLTVFGAVSLGAGVGLVILFAAGPVGWLLAASLFLVVAAGGAVGAGLGGLFECLSL
jgi:RHS repeat-associated protein